MKIGFAFPEHIKSERTGHKRHFSSGSLAMRDLLLPAFIVLFTGILLLKLFWLQVVQGTYYRGLSDSNRIRTRIIHAPRGIIFDRLGNPLVYNIPGYRKIQGDKTILLSQEEALARIARGEKHIETDSLRQYPYRDAFSHVLGYISQISKEQLVLPEFHNYSINDLVGKAGIEEQYESLLRGIDGKQLVEVDAMGKEVRKLGQTDPLAGQNITLTVDLELQQKAYEAMGNVKKGAVVVSSPTGEILALVSKPSFDENLFTLDKTYRATDSAYKSIEAVLSDSSGQPLLNRAISGTYPPGSTFKLVTAASGLENDIINDQFTVNDTGIVTVGEFSFSNWYFTQYGKTEGAVNIYKAIARSNDTFFYKVAEKIRVDRISAMAEKFGIGRRLGIDLSGEAEGVLPTESWKKQVIGEPWYLGDTYHYGIGQGYLLTTPLQVNTFTQVIASGGNLNQPNLLKGLKEKKHPEVVLREKTVHIIRDGMVQACERGGTAYPLFDFAVKNAKRKIDGKNILEVPKATTSADFADYRKVTIACKTGTAQHGDEQTMPHAWITLFAPAYNPEVVVTVLVESAGEGSSVAAPIAQKILETWFSK